MKNIIAAVDFSASSNNAACYAADLAAAIGAELHLVHAIDLPQIPRDSGIPDYVLDEIRNAGFNSLKNLADELGRRVAHKVTIATDLETGQVQTGVKNFCLWKHPFLVVRGASVTSDPEIRNLPYPLLSVPSHASFHSVRHIVLALGNENFSKTMPVQTHYLRELRDLLHASFKIVDNPEKHPETSVESHGDAGNMFTDWIVLFSKKGDISYPLQQMNAAITLHCPLTYPGYHQ